MLLFNKPKKLYIENLGGPISVVVPHDDDIIGCVGAVYDARLNRIPVSVIVMTNGELGYLDVNQKDTIVKDREDNAKVAYNLLGVDDVVFLGFPDTKLDNYKSEASLKLIEELRKREPKTAFFTTEEDHLDHQSAYKISRHVIFTQMGYPNVPDLGQPVEVENVLEYGVWNKLKKPTHYFKLPEEIQRLKEELLEVFGDQKKVLEKLGIDFKIEKFKKLH